MTLFQAILLGLSAFVLSSSLVGGAWNQVFSRPIVVSFVCGIIMGDMPAAMNIGVVLQAMYLGVMTVGGVSSMPTITISQWFAIPLAIQQGSDAEFAIAICLTFSAVETVVSMGLMQLKLINVHKGDALIEEGKLKQAYWVHLAGQLWDLAKFLIIIPVAGLLGSSVISSLAAALPAWVLGVLGIFIGFCPLIGFCLLLNGLVADNFQLIFFVLGFTLVKTLGLGILTITILACAIAYVVFLGSAKSAKEGA